MNSVISPLYIRELEITTTDKILVHDPSKCTGCCQCMIACSYKHFKVFDLNQALLYVNEDPTQPGRFINAHCSHCIHPMCMAACPKDAIYRDEKGIVRISPLKCVGCGICSYACPISIPRKHPRLNIYVKCDLCDGDPMCVKMCSAEALKLLPREEAFKVVAGLRGGEVESKG